MADSLEDFFAKKDKSKKKGKGRFVTADLLPPSGADVSGGGGGGATTNSEPDEAKKTRKKKDRDQSGAQGSGAAKGSQDDGDWKDYEVEEEKDYSGLRIQNLQSKAENEDADEDGRETEYTEDGSVIQRREEIGPWNKAQGTQPPSATGATVEAAPTNEGVDSEAATAPAAAQPSSTGPLAAAAAVPGGDGSRGAAAAAVGQTPGKYVPPSMRGKTATASSGASPAAPSYLGMKSRKKTAPNLTSEEDFPSLGGLAAERPFDTDTTSFEKVRGGGKDRDGNAAAPRLELANKFDALSS